MLSVCWLLTERQQVKLRACEVGGKCEYLSLGREYEARSSAETYTVGGTNLGM